jgi:hypothetical protein
VATIIIREENARSKKMRLLEGVFWSVEFSYLMMVAAITKTKEYSLTV